MYVGIAKISLVICESHSLKQTRMVLRRIKDRVRERVGVIVNEVGEQDTWQRAELGCAVASGESQVAGELLDDVVRVIAGADRVIDGALAGLTKAAGFLRGPIGRTVGLQHAPELRFFVDKSIDMKDKLAEILREDEMKAKAAGRVPGVAEPVPVTEEPPKDAACASPLHSSW